MANLEKNYDPKQIEDKWYAQWEADRVFHREAAEGGRSVYDRHTSTKRYRKIAHGACPE